jgi:hypothetical protein
MLKLFLFSLIILFIISERSFSQSNNYYQRQWENTNSDMNISFANSNIHYTNNQAPQININNIWEANAWKGEKINTQILIWSKIDLTHFAATRS